MGILAQKYDYYETRIKDPNRYKDIEEALDQIVNEFEVRIRKTKSKTLKTIYDIMRELLIEVFDRVDKVQTQFEKYGVYGEALQMAYTAKILTRLVSDLMAKYKIADKETDKKLEEIERKLYELYSDLRELKSISEELLSKCF